MKSDTKNKTKKILIVDDDKDIVFLFRKWLERSYTILVAYSGDEALSILETQKVDLVLMDIRMPGINGIDTTRIIKEKNKNIPIIAITAYSEVENKHLEDNPFDKYLRKPISLKTLSSEIGKIIS